MICMRAFSNDDFYKFNFYKFNSFAHFWRFIATHSHSHIAEQHRPSGKKFGIIKQCKLVGLFLVSSLVAAGASRSTFSRNEDLDSIA